MASNPFRPSTGASPPELIGRGPLLDAIAESLADGPGAPGRLTIMTGQRGVGKTVMLNEAAEVARRHGWRFADLTATPALLTRLDVEVSRLLAEEEPSGRQVSGVEIAHIGGVSFGDGKRQPTDVRTNLTALLDVLARRGSGLMLTVDEVHAGARADLRELGALTQHMVREDREFALVMAGLPAAVSSLLSDDVLTFLRRADRHTLAGLEIDDVDDALRKTFSEHDRVLDTTLARLAAEASQGYPFLVQLIGYHVWRQSSGDRVDRPAVDAGLEEARRRLRTQVHEPALSDLSESDRRFLVAMAEDDGRSSVGDLATRLGRDKHHVNTYRRRLIDAQVIEPVSRGYVGFTIPFLRDHLRDHGAGAG